MYSDWQRIFPGPGQLPADATGSLGLAFRQAHWSVDSVRTKISRFDFVTLLNIDDIQMMDTAVGLLSPGANCRPTHRRHGEIVANRENEEMKRGTLY
jgi:hypothetical protein